LVALASEVVTDLRWTGTSWAGTCPFCGDRGRAFLVHPNVGRWLCRTCSGRGGDAIDFVMRTRRIPFPGAVRFVAERSHLAVPAGAEHWRPAPVEPSSDACSDSTVVVLDLHDDVYPYGATPPTRPCKACRGVAYHRAGAGWSCARCHPPVPGKVDG
jgi:hypothetical protein